MIYTDASYYVIGATVPQQQDEENLRRDTC